MKYLKKQKPKEILTNYGITLGKNKLFSNAADTQLRMRRTGLAENQLKGGYRNSFFKEKAAHVLPYEKVGYGCRGKFELNN